VTNNAQDIFYTKRIVVIGIVCAIAHDFRSFQQRGIIHCEHLHCGREKLTYKKRILPRQLKDEGFIKVMWTLVGLYSSDLYTRNLARVYFEKHAKFYVGDDKYMKV
jgi:hypothetical protein